MSDTLDAAQALRGANLRVTRPRVAALKAVKRGGANGARIRLPPQNAPLAVPLPWAAVLCWRQPQDEGPAQPGASLSRRPSCVIPIQALTLCPPRRAASVLGPIR